MAVETCEHLALHVHHFRQVFLHPFHACQCVFERRDRVDPGRSRRGIG
jgi:hypothetical protein